MESGRMEPAQGKKKSRAAVFVERLFSTLLLWGVVAGVVVSGRIPVMVLLVGTLGVLGAVEFYRLTAKVPGRECRVWALVVSLLYLGGLCWSYLAGEERLTETFTLEMAGLVAVLLGAFTLRLRFAIEGSESVQAVAMSVLAYLYVPVLFACFVLRLMFFPGEGATGSSGVWLVLLVVLVTKFTDMGAYAVGSLIGKHKAIPHISPAKSWEGYIGSLFFALGGAFAIYFLGREHFGWLGSIGHVVALGLIAAVAAMVGDLAESILKRSLKVKDSGHMLPGIGGVLDLLDSICFSAPMAFFYLVVFA